MRAAHHAGARFAARLRHRRRSRPTGPTPRAWIATCEDREPAPRGRGAAFARFPTWMWRNHETLDVRRVAARAQRSGATGSRPRRLLRARPVQPVHLDPRGARLPRPRRSRTPRRWRAQRYGCLTPWEGDPRRRTGAPRSPAATACASRRRSRCCATCSRSGSTTREQDGERFLDAVQNARVVANAERYYRAMYYGGERVLEPARPPHVRDARGAARVPRRRDSKAVVWEHNSHVGDAARDRDGRARRAQRRPALPRAFGARAPF